MAKSSAGNFFEDFSVGQELVHAAPRTITVGDAALYAALYGTRFAPQSSDAFAQSVGLPRAPLDSLLLFHVVFGKTVPDVSLNAVANLGYAECRFLKAVYPGDSVTARSTVIGMRENANGRTGIVYVRSRGFDQDGAEVLSFIRWVMVNKRDPSSPAPEPVVPATAAQVDAAALVVPEGLDLSRWDAALGGSPHRFEDYEVGERIDHIDGMTIEEAEHQIATRLYQNTAKGHFDGLLQQSSRFGRRILYGGHVISLARALSFNGLANGAFVAAINGGRHVNPAAAGDTVYCGSEILDAALIPGRSDVGALRVRTFATRNRRWDAGSPPGADDPAILLDLDAWLLMPRRAGAAGS